MVTILSLIVVSFPLCYLYRRYRQEVKNKAEEDLAILVMKKYDQSQN